MNVQTLLKLPILGAAIKEGIRLISPVPLGLTRLVPEGGHTIAGDFFLEGTVVSYMQCVAKVCPHNYSDPKGFHINRWLRPEGPRDCIGQNLARMGIVLILGKLLSCCDLQAQGSLDWWEDQETYAVWAKAPAAGHVAGSEGTELKCRDMK
ncbi:cytochrome P450 [Aspergillus uvarum CBS 121591]|uniref:Cytochrome P450 n=1 Tax=Aspergillus uvarum CBS 121591 TaxID=1448315 RepID=A0A319CRD2_9EURO|nr:cytochrome P450 [Aspergillus uvarum CBS 121591]PYH86751.1 cytochrome P450 [Aspergillus uvarum CBS 121591]